MIFILKVFIGHGEQQDCLYQSNCINNAPNPTRPAKCDQQEQRNNAPAPLPGVKFVDTERPEQQAKHSGGNPIAYRSHAAGDKVSVKMTKDTVYLTKRILRGGGSGCIRNLTLLLAKTVTRLLVGRLIVGRSCTRLLAKAVTLLLVRRLVARGSSARLLIG